MNGMILVPIVIMLLIMGMIAFHAIDDMLVETKIFNNIKRHWENLNQLEDALKKEEQTLEEKSMRWLGFVPDTLNFGCEEGIDVYQFTVFLDDNDQNQGLMATHGIR